MYTDPEKPSLGLKLSVQGDLLSNLRFADDVVLFAHRVDHVEQMVEDLAQTSARYGLKLNFSKTKVLTWDALAKGRSTIEVSGQKVAIIKEDESEKYLGRKLGMSRCQEVEISNRLAAGWATFHEHKGELCNPF